MTLSNTLALGAGCYWGTEKFIVKDFQEQYPNSIKDAKVGFMSPDPNAMKNPSYRQVCSGTTGHVEVLNIELNDPETNFEKLLQFFFMFHDPTTKNRQGNDTGSSTQAGYDIVFSLLLDPTTKNRQGNDTGTQYASWIFCGDDEQLAVAEKVKAELQSAVSAGKVKYLAPTVETQIGRANEFYPAHEEHQEYLMKNPLGYCNHRYRFREWPEPN
eukprot:CAMPEP_0116837156 /NCGR_PEP_ID=MMETSP0418-20121206/8497_1 /TAXON_ID=1158023 /ORGANISM="Astrosyne radiata, Strain 13vi08-1A" /LENGTH=213 /DNA_ID=CAMNT_0004467009 /DNA_START=82 /DNA_END=724 /DNA_ORIENTATION=+